jgi:hypothetical protein
LPVEDGGDGGGVGGGDEDVSFVEVGVEQQGCSCVLDAGVCGYLA